MYDFPFDPAVGYGTIVSHHAHALLPQGESLDKAPEALRTHVGREVELLHENVGTAKDYAGLYRSVMEQFRPLPEYGAKVYDTRQARRFYSSAELNGFRQWWTRPIGAS